MTGVKNIFEINVRKLLMIFLNYNFYIFNGELKILISIRNFK